MEDCLGAILTDVISRVDLEGGRLDAATEGQLTLALHEFLLSLTQIKGFAVVVIDDAHLLAQSRLDDLRALADKHPRLLGIVFVGSRKLLAMVGQAGPGTSAAPDLLRVRLEPLAEDEVRGYVSHRITVGDTGGTGVDFDDQALASLYNVSGGVPLVINRVAARALMVGAGHGTAIVDAAVVEAALRELDMVAPEPIVKRVMYDVAVAGGLVALMLIGAAAGAFIFRAHCDR